MISEALAIQIAIGLFTVGGAWAVMRAQLQRASEDIEHAREEIGELRGIVNKVSLQVAYLNGQLAARGVVPHSLPPDLKS